MELISKKEFCEIIKQLRGAKDLQEQVGELYRNSECNRAHDYCNYGAIQINHEDIVIKLLKVMFDDVIDDIHYFVYELNFGRKYKDGMVISIDKEGNETRVDLSTEENLYDYLIENMKARDEG